MLEIFIPIVCSVNLFVSCVVRAFLSSALTKLSKNLSSDIQEIFPQVYPQLSGNVFKKFAQCFAHL